MNSIIPLADDVRQLLSDDVGQLAYEVKTVRIALTVNCRHNCIS